jgi:hypothetical protein
MVNDGTYLYWIDDCVSSTHQVRRMSLTTGAVSTLWTPTSGHNTRAGLKNHCTRANLTFDHHSKGRDNNTGLSRC